MNEAVTNPIVLAYIGDSVYELYIRKYLLTKNSSKVDVLQKSSINYVSAKAQSRIVTYLMDNNILTDDEIDLVKRARNYKRSNHPKHTDIITYKYATGFEALLGHLYLNNKIDRIEEIMKHVEGE